MDLVDHALAGRVLEPSTSTLPPRWCVRSSRAPTIPDMPTTTLVTTEVDGIIRACSATLSSRMSVLV
jgi:hypothetical protein